MGEAVCGLSGRVAVHGWRCGVVGLVWDLAAREASSVYSVLPDCLPAIPRDRSAYQMDVRKVCRAKVAVGNWRLAWINCDMRRSFGHFGLGEPTKLRNRQHCESAQHRHTDTSIESCASREALLVGTHLCMMHGPWLLDC